MSKRVPKIHSFDLKPGRKLASKYEVISKLGAGWEGEVYKVSEISTGIERAAKLFFPQRNVRNRAARVYARKLHKLRRCSILIQYHTKEIVPYRRIPVTALISDYVEGILLSDFLQRMPGKRLPPYQATHLLYALAKGIEEIHLLNEYHGDLHTENIIVNKYGLTFEIKLLDMFNSTDAKIENMRDDICSLVQIYHECMGGRKHYRKLPQTVKNICCGLKRSLILKKFRTVSQLREHLELMEWEYDW